jgi:hypothetical protein
MERKPTEFRFRIDEEFKGHGIEIAFPQSDIHKEVPLASMESFPSRGICQNSPAKRGERGFFIKVPLSLHGMYERYEDSIEYCSVVEILDME